MVELQCGYHVKKLRTDRGGEYMSTDLVKFCEDLGIERQLTIAYSPQHNGVAERKNRTVVEMAKCMIHEKELPYSLWCEAALENITPFEKFSGRKPGIKQLKVFGFVCYPLIPRHLRHKLEATSAIEVFIGYGACQKGYRILNFATQKVLLSRDVIFDENGKWDWKKHKVKEVCIPLPADEISDIRTTKAETAPQEQVRVDGSQVEIESPLATEGVEPENFDEAAQDEAWKKAMETKMNMIEKN
ncbi:unnamed protein product [Prunus armeniaca]